MAAGGLSVARDATQLLEAVLDGVVVLDRDGGVEHVNSEACRILASSFEALRGRPVEELTPAPAIARAARRALGQAASAVVHDQALERRLEPAVRVDVATSPLFDPGGHVDGALVLLRDRTIGNSLREMWDERESLAALGRIASGIAHEIRNPLGGIRGAAELLAARVTETKSREIAERIVREVDRIGTLVEDFLVFARGDELRLVPVNVHRVLDDVLALLAMDPIGTRAKVVRRFDPSIPELLADADRLTQVFHNLVRNALEAMDPSGGTLTIRTRTTLDRRRDPRGGRRLPNVTVEITDTGSGIGPEALEHVTTPFFTTKPHGSGLGLALVRRFVALHDGTFQLENAHPRGATARVSLPLRRAS